MTAVDWLIVFVLNAGVIAWGVFLARGTRTSRDWFLGGRTLPWWAVGLSMFATNIDNADLVSVAGKTFTEGMHIITVHTLGTTVGGVIAAFFLVPAMYRAGLYTNAEYLEARFGPATRILSAVIQIQYRSSMLGLMIWSVHRLLTGLVGLSEPAAWAVVVALAVCAAIYTAWGGLRSVVLTDAFQGVILLIGGLVVFAAVWRAAGGWSGLEARLAELPASQGAAPSPVDLVRVSSYRGGDGSVSPMLIALGWVLIGGGYWTVNHTQTMRLMGSRSIWDMKMAAVFGTVVGMPLMVACAALGVFGRALYPEFDDPDGIFPHLADRVLDPGLKGLVVAGMVAAAVSTFDSMGSALSAIFTRDIWARLVAPRRDDAHYLRVSRWATVTILALGFAYLPFIRSKRHMLDAFLTLIPVFVTPLFTLYLAGVFTRAHRSSGFAGLLAGSAYGIAALLGRESIIDGLPTWLTGRWAALGWSALVTAAAIALVTVIRGRTRSDGAESVADGVDAVGTEGTDGWLERSRGELPPLREHPFEGEVPILLRPAWLAVVGVLASAWIVFAVFW